MSQMGMNTSHALNSIGWILIFIAGIAFAYSFSSTAEEPTDKTTIERMSAYTGNDSEYLERMAKPAMERAYKYQLRWGSPWMAGSGLSFIWMACVLDLLLALVNKGNALEQINQAAPPPVPDDTNPDS